MAQQLTLKNPAISPGAKLNAKRCEKKNWKLARAGRPSISGRIVSWVRSSNQGTQSLAIMQTTRTVDAAEALFLGKDSNSQESPGV